MRCTAFGAARNITTTRHLAAQNISVLSGVLRFPVLRHQTKWLAARNAMPNRNMQALQEGGRRKAAGVGRRGNGWP